MKKNLFLSMLLTSILANLCAQNNQADKAFSVPDYIIINRRFYIALDNENKLKIELTDLTDLDKLANIDSLLQVFLNDIAPLKDSLANPLTAKRIDYVTDAQGRKKVRFQQFQPQGASFLINKNELASLRTTQDTINLVGIITNPAKAVQKISLTNPRYYHLTFYLNDVNELTGYMNGILKGKINTIRTNVKGKWGPVLGGSLRYLKADKAITADKAEGASPPTTGDYLTGFITINVQNYKQYFVPSFSLGLRFTLSNRDRTFKWEPGLLWEPHYLFARDQKDRLKTYRNDFLTLIYAQGGTTDHDPRKDFSFSAVFSAGYLINRNGDFFAKNTVRLGAGKIQMLKTSLEPSIYFNNFFKGVTPGIRITQSF